ncbi:ArgS-related anticodon-binding protein NrtL [Streptomyces sp. ALI-76-A]|uniref:ArgS-related anticodon-binding protein NrtL n=1 Tax=Streptomyces sp. ALI-76-A TaxID=3025736 RepID=UPI00256EC666|nr:DALR anticodon-binding domain-containing protein [Streptomyces sp. ALI-76-A]MDL5203811.1 DALR anticodon-binding domain-containing protein [Streptomyces sp. ALI-76-A]
MTPVELSRTVLRAVRRAVDVGELNVTVPERAVVTVPGPGGCGDYATNIALQLARAAGRPPRQVAEILRPRLADADGVRDVVVTGPGFLNISLRGSSSAALVEEILRRGPRYGYVEQPGGHVVRLHAPHEVRAVVVMDVVARLLRSQGALVHTSCDACTEPACPEPAWVDVLGVRLDTYDAPSAPDAPTPLEGTGKRTGTSTSTGTATIDIAVRPVPATLTPHPLDPDATRWALLHPAAHNRPRTTGEHLVQRESNPLFRVRYAHARTRALARNAADLGFHAEPGDAGAYDHDGLVGVLADHPRVLAAAAAQRAPDRLARHLVTVADAVLPFLPAVLPRGEEKPSAAHRARLALAEAAGTVLAGGLSLLGIDAPDHL